MNSEQTFDQAWERVKWLTGWKNYSEMADFLEIKGPSVSGAKKRGVMPLDWLYRIAIEYGGEVQWLATGAEPTFQTPGRTNRPAGESTPGLDLDEYVLVPRYDVQVSAGDGSLVESDMQPFESMAFRRNWVKRMGLDVNKLAVVTTRGDSMEPTLSDGDIVLVDLRQTTIVDGAIHVLRNNGDVLVKRLQRGFGDQIIVRSDNHIYRELEATVDELNVVGRVVWRGGRM